MSRQLSDGEQVIIHVQNLQPEKSYHLPLITYCQSLKANR